MGLPPPRPSQPQLSAENANSADRVPRKASSELVNITQCPILGSEHNVLIQPLRAVLNDLQAVPRAR
ncbi:23S rRNA (uracil(1939)-C(5))-methyltransferase RlmD domain protein [Candidatus Erwinia dacicola]|uniref:23S rRNA (Uracil(1939)-C(5))-methyltransferase RlmD domain protein n=1 Tax=Candidatus Erwinia dacicola TaxID=252393 RepID=A0A328TLC4_9GAMM|nr:23S rRNA (uracil(1939)-C(5))-methyltransferase RlmD domain protein [Candidatus Erwinia dacicola]